MCPPNGRSAVSSMRGHTAHYAAQHYCWCNVSVMMSSERECQFAVQTFVLQYVYTRTIIITKARCQPQARPLLKETRPVLRSEA